MLRFVVIYPLLALFVVLRGVWPAFDSKRVRWLLAASLVPGAIYPAVVLFIGGSTVAPDLPQMVIIAGQLAQMYLFCLALLLAAREIVSVLARIFGLPLNYLAHARPLAVAIFSLAVVLDVYGVWTVVNVIRVKEVSIPIKNLPQGLENLTIAHISDIHASSLVDAERVRRIVETANALHPDMVALTGDFVDGTVQKRFKDLEPLKDLKAPMGVWGVLGNHEYYVDLEGWKEALPQLNISMLYNEHATLEKNGVSFTVVGLLDPMAQRYGLELPDIKKALNGAPTTNLTVLLSHQPKWAGNYVDDADLMLSGHTHGAQIFVLKPVVGKLNQGLVEGLYTITSTNSLKKLQLYVNPGVDVWSGFALRIGTQGEITLIRLTREE